MAHGRGEQGVGPDQVGGDAERAHELRQVGHAQRTLQVAQVLEHLQAVGPVEDAAVLLGGEAGGDDVVWLAGLVDGGDEAVASVGEGASAVDDLVQDGVEVEACVDAQDGGAQGGDALAQRRDLLARLVVAVDGHEFCSLKWIPPASRFPVRGPRGSGGRARLGRAARRAGG